MRLSPLTRKGPPKKWTQHLGLWAKSSSHGAQTGPCSTWDKECEAGRASKGIFLVPPPLLAPLEPEQACSW